MKREYFCIGLLTLSILFQQCSTKPEPIHYGTDVCYFCKMTLMDNKFGAELITVRGKVYKFDDLNCMLNFYHSGEEQLEDFSYKLVVNYEKPGEFLNADEAHYLKSEAIRSPMASKMAAFASYEGVKIFKQKWGGIYLAWGEALTQFK